MVVLCRELLLPYIGIVRYSSTGEESSITQSWKSVECRWNKQNVYLSLMNQSHHLENYIANKKGKQVAGYVPFTFWHFIIRLRWVFSMYQRSPNWLLYIHNSIRINYIFFNYFSF